MTKTPKPRYSIATITTSDASLIELSNSVRSNGWTHEDIYRIGLNTLSSENGIAEKDKK